MLNGSALDLRIDELILHDLPDVDPAALREAIGAELARLFTEQGVPPLLERWGALPLLDAGRFELSPSAGAQAAGTAVARALYAGLSQPAAGPAPNRTENAR